MADDQDLRDLMLEAGAEVQSLAAEFMQELMLPQMQGQAAQLWGQLPEEMRERFAKERPQEYAAFMNMLK